MKNIFKALFKPKKKRIEYTSVPSFVVLQSFFNQISRKRLIEALPNDDNKEKLTDIVNEGYLALNSKGKPKKAKNAVNQRFILGLMKIYLDYGKNIKIKQKN